MTTNDTTLAAARALLSSDLGEPNDDLSRSLAQFAGTVQAAVPSYCGLSITVATDGVPITIAVTADGPAAEIPAAAATAVTSLAVPLSAISATTEGELVLFASAAGAFVDLAADLAFATATELVAFALDTRLGVAVALPVGVGAFSVIHQAVGVLIEAGYTPEQARARIAQIAANDHHDLAAAAARIVSGQQTPAPSQDEPLPPAPPRK